MANLGYNRGANFERDVVKFYQNIGYCAGRFAGSKGFHNYEKKEKGLVDVIAVPPKKLTDFNLGFRPIFIQCKHSKNKYNSMTQEEKKVFLEYAQKYNATAVLAIRLRKTKTSDGIELHNLEKEFELIN